MLPHPVLDSGSPRQDPSQIPLFLQHPLTSEAETGENGLWQAKYQLGLVVSEPGSGLLFSSCPVLTVPLRQSDCVSALPKDPCCAPRHPTLS